MSVGQLSMLALGFLKIHIRTSILGGDVYARSP